jgi:hypothetical protein
MRGGEALPLVVPENRRNAGKLKKFSSLLADSGKRR